MRHKWTVLDNQKKKLNKIHKDLGKVEKDTKSVKESASKILEICRGLSYGRL